MHWLPHLASKFVKYRFTKLRLCSLRDEVREESKIVFKLPFASWKHIWTKNQGALSNSKNAQLWFQEQWLAGSTSELAEGQITKLLQLTSTNIRKETKIIVKLLFLTQKCVLTNNQRALSNSKNVLTLIQGALVGWVFPKMGERSIY